MKTSSNREAKNIKEAEQRAKDLLKDLPIKKKPYIPASIKPSKNAK
ncbi:hypothetical protein [Agarilytica rhodophyticola]|nr:hypothetical protein [Agarilytica rhodophyticola]